MENYELSSDNIKEVDRATSQIKNWLNDLKNKLNGKNTTEQSSEQKTEQSSEQKTQQSSEQKTEQSSEQKTQQSSEQKTEQSSEQKTEQSSEQKTEQSSEQKTEQQTDKNDLFYEINDKKATLKMDIVKNYLDMIKDKEWNELKSNNPAAWIMAVQIALRSTQIWGENHDKYWKIQIDGILGQNTKDAVKKFQEENSLTADGLPGKNTLNKIYDILDWKTTTNSTTTSTENSSSSSTESTSSSTESSSSATAWATTTTWTSAETSSESQEKEPEDSKIVSIKDYIKDIQFDMRYATTNNFTWQKIYNDADAKLRYWTIKKLKVAQDELIKKWYSIKIWDAYRPQSAQVKLRNVRPDPTLVARPEKWSAHTKWNTVDITLVKSDGTEIPMPSEFDDNNKAKVDRNYSDLTEEQRTNAKILEDAMKKAWFNWYDKEWWHYSDTKNYPMERGD